MQIYSDRRTIIHTVKYIWLPRVLWQINQLNHYGVVSFFLPMFYLASLTLNIAQSFVKHIVFMQCRDCTVAIWARRYLNKLRFRLGLVVGLWGNFFQWVRLIPIIMGMDSMSQCTTGVKFNAAASFSLVTLSSFGSTLFSFNTRVQSFESSFLPSSTWLESLQSFSPSDSVSDSWLGLW